MKLYESYIEILEDVYQNKKKTNPQYTLSSLSRDAGYKSYHLSDVLSGRYGVSPKKAINIANRLKMSHNQKKQFILLVRYKHSKSKTDRMIAAEELNTLKLDMQEMWIDTNSLDQLNEWYDLAILNLARSKKFNVCSTEISNRLCLSVEKVESSLDKLKKLNFLNTEDNTFNEQVFLKISKKGQTSKTIQNLHKQNLDLAKDALEKYPVSKRDFRNRICLLTEKQYIKIVTELNTKIRQIFFDFVKNEKLLSKNEEESHLYSFSSQLFPLEKILE